MQMQKVLQRVLLVLGVLCLLAVVVELILTVVSSMPGNTPVRVVHVTAGPYPLTLSLYKDPADAGYYLPFALAPQAGTKSGLTFTVSSVPGDGVDATPVRASLNPDPNLAGGVRGSVEITVRGPWSLHVSVNGPAGPGSVNVPVTAVAPPAIPSWLGWVIGLLPVYAILAFLLMQRSKKNRPQPVYSD
jgi:hypothetical protein